MIETLGIIAAISFVIWIIVKFFKGISKGVSNSVQTNSSQKIRIELSFPHPEKAIDFRFYKHVENEPVYKIEAAYREMKKRDMKIKPEFEKALQTKIKKGEFNNPLNFKDYFGTSFDLIGLQFLKGTDNILSAFQIGVCFIQNGKVADTETYNFCPPKRIVQTKRFQNTLALFDYEQEWIEDHTFKDIWEIFDLRDFLTNNLVVVWDEEAKVLEKVLNYAGIKDYNISVLKVREIAQANGLPDSIDSLLNHFNSDSSLKDNMSLIVSELAVELRDSGININNYVKRMSSQPKQTKSIKKPETKNIDIDFIALDVETAIGKRWSICQIGISIVENGEIKQTISELIQPPNNEYSIWNTRIHGITKDMTENKPLFPAIWEKIYPIIDSKKIVAHNAEFDINCLRQTLEYYDLTISKFDYDCTYKLTGQKFEDACCTYGINLNNHHDAGCDAEACARLYLKVQSGEVPDFSKIKQKKQSKQSIMPDGHDRLQGDVLKPDLENANPDSPFYNKKVVFTGVLDKIKRQEAAEMVKIMGADINTGITKKTNFVITGKDPGPSKMNKIIRYNNDGCDIKILNEKDFLKMLNK